jgi:hypothetical protein
LYTGAEEGQQEIEYFECTAIDTTAGDGKWGATKVDLHGRYIEGEWANCDQVDNADAGKSMQPEAKGGSYGTIIIVVVVVAVVVLGLIGAVLAQRERASLSISAEAVDVDDFTDEDGDEGGAFGGGGSAAERDTQPLVYDGDGMAGDEAITLHL